MVYMNQAVPSFFNQHQHSQHSQHSHYKLSCLTCLHQCHWFIPLRKYVWKDNSNQWIWFSIAQSKNVHGSFSFYLFRALFITLFWAKTEVRFDFLSKENHQRFGMRGEKHNRNPKTCFSENFAESCGKKWLFYIVKVWKSPVQNWEHSAIVFLFRITFTLSIWNWSGAKFVDCSQPLNLCLNLEIERELSQNLFEKESAQSCQTLMLLLPCQVVATDEEICDLRTFMISSQQQRTFISGCCLLWQKL